MNINLGNRTCQKTLVWYGVVFFAFALAAVVGGNFFLYFDFVGISFQCNVMHYKYEMQFNTTMHCKTDRIYDDYEISVYIYTALQQHLL